MTAALQLVEVKNEFLVDSRIIAEHLGLQHESVFKLVGCGYVEFSPSGNGLRGFGYGPSIKGTRGQLDGVNVELYSSARYLTVTGHLYREEPIQQLPGFSDVADAIKARPVSQAVDTHREYRDYSSNNSVLSALSVGDAIARTMPFGEGERHRRLFDFARHVKALHPNATQDELRQIARQWHEAALPVIGTKDFLTTWSDFSNAFDSVRYPAGTGLKQIIGDIDMKETIPDRLVELGYSAKSAQLFHICQRLQEQAGDEPPSSAVQS